MGRATAKALIIGTLVAAVIGLLVRLPARESPPHQTASDEMTIRGLRTSMYDADGLQFRVSADSVQVAPPHLLGPFRLGFMRSVTAKNVTIETIEQSPRDGSRPLAARDVSRALSALTPKQIGTRIMSAEVGPVRFLRHQRDQSEVLLEAERCQISPTTIDVVCEDGRLREETGETHFHRASYDGRAWTIER